MSKYSGRWDPIIGRQEEILYAILLELEKLNDNNNIELGLSELEQLDDTAKSIETKPKAICKTCGKVHEHAWEYGVCARKNKQKQKEDK